MAAAVPANSSDGMGNGLAVATWRIFFWGRSGVLWRRLGGGGMGTGGGGDNDPRSTTEAPWESISGWGGYRRKRYWRYAAVWVASGGE